MMVHKWYCWVIGLSIVAAGITIPVAVYFALQVSDACANEDTSTCDAVKGNCTNVESTWRCDCKEGYTNAAGDTQTCEDIDECLDGDTSSCEAGKGNCVNMDSTWRCDCNDGYRNAEGDTHTCEDINECIDGDTSSCEAGKGSCLNMDSTWKCDCNEGYRNVVGDMHTCEDMDECIEGDTSSCEAGKGNCVNMVSTWRCDCNDGYRNAQGDMRTCEDIDECIEGDTSSCAAGKGNCVNVDSTWRCDCNDGNRNAEGDTHTCEDIDECMDGDTSSCEASKGSCVNMDSTWRCDCNDGYRNAVGDMRTCEDIDECNEGDPSSCEDGKGNCVNMDSTWRCDCNDGYRNAEGDMRTCEDIDECVEGDTSSCEAGKGNCVNMDSTWRCDCNDGYRNAREDTHTCEEAGMCSTVNTSSCVSGRGYCISMESNWACDCNEGYINPAGDPYTCEEVEMCSVVDTSSCVSGRGQCISMESTWTCDCNEGYINPAGDPYTCEEPNMCSTVDTSSCVSGRGQCISMESTWTCDCNEGYINPVGDPYTCEEAEMCLIVDTSSCVSGRGQCISMESTWTCDCNEGYSNPAGNPYTCEAITCGKHTDLSAEEGELEFPDSTEHETYPPNMDCVWDLSTTAGKALEITFSQFILEDCAYGNVYDYLELNEDSRTELFCGLDKPGNDGVYITTSNNIRLLFHSDEDVGLEGFKLTWRSVDNHCLLEDTSSCADNEGYCRTLEDTWECVCKDVVSHVDTHTKICAVAPCGKHTDLSAEEGELEFPDSTRHESYPPNTDCVWDLSTTAGKALEITFSMFSVESCSSSGIAYDYLEINEDFRTKSFCGYDKPGDDGVYLTSTNNIRLLFHSDNALELEGFKLTWKSVNNHCFHEDTSSCPNNAGYCLSLEDSWECVCKDAFYHVDTHNKICEEERCGIELQTPAEEGTLEFPGGGAVYYENDQDCSWTLTTTPGKVLTLTFSEFDIESHSKCNYDYLEIYDGWTMKDRFCGNELPGANGVYTTTLNEIRLFFHSDESSAEQGFKLTWTSD